MAKQHASDDPIRVPNPIKSPNTSGAETALTAAEAVIAGGMSFVPVVGGVISAGALFLGEALKGPLKRRERAYLDSIAEGVEALRARISGVEERINSDVFVSAFLQAGHISMRTHQREKLEAARNAVLNIAAGTAPEEDLQPVLLALLDSLTPWHLKLLAFLNDPMGWMVQNGLTPPGAPTAKGSNLIGFVFPSLPVRDALPEVYLRQLVSQGLLRADWDEQLPYKHPDLSGASRTTPFGKQLLAFITSPVAEAQDTAAAPARGMEAP